MYGGIRVLVVVLCLISLSTSLSAAELCRSTDVIDGDTVVLDCEKYSGIFGLSGIDAPEINQPKGKEAAVFLKELLKDKELVLVNVERSGNKGKIVFQGGKSIAPRIVKAGLAWATERDGTDNSFFKLEKKAKKAKVGLWENPDQEPPWVYRERLNVLDDEEYSFDDVMARIDGDGTGNSMRECLKIKDPTEQLICKDKVYSNFNDEATKAIQGKCVGMSGESLRECLYGAIRTSKKIAKKYQ